MLLWTGYLYRFRHFYAGECGKAIYAHADADTMNACYLGFHTLDEKTAADRLRRTAP